MEERDFDDITVNDLCERADLNRGTFYNHFRDKDDLLATLENEVIADLDHFKSRCKTLRFVTFGRTRPRSGRCPCWWNCTITCANR